MGNSAIKKAVGMLQNQAYLEVLDYEPEAWDNLSRESGSNQAGKMLNLAKNMLKSGVQSLSQTKAGKIAGEYMESRGVDEGVIKVQYNPSSLHMDFQMQDEDAQSKAKQQEEGILFVPHAATLLLHVDLLLHSESALDATVAEQMNLMLTVMHKKKKRRVRFYWSEMVFEGSLSSFEGKYTMFYPSGLPAAGEMKITISAILDAKQAEKKMQQMVEAEREAIE